MESSLLLYDPTVFWVGVTLAFVLMGIGLVKTIQERLYIRHLERLEAQQTRHLRQQARYPVETEGLEYSAVRHGTRRVR